MICPKHFAVTNILLFAITYTTSFTTLHYGGNYSAKFSAIVSVGAVVINLGIFLLIQHYLYAAAKVGIQASDIKALKDQNIYFMQMEGDIICDEHVTKKLIKGQKNMQSTCITHSNIQSILTKEIAECGMKRMDQDSRHNF